MAWEVKRLGDVCEVGDGNYSSKYPKASEFIEKGIPFLTATNLKNGTIVPDGMRFISEHLHKSLKKGHVIKDDLVIVVRGSSTGNNSKIPKNYEGANLNSQLAFLRVKDTKLDSAYLFAAFNNPFVMDKVKSLISGSAQPQLPINKLVSIEIQIPPLAEQKRIVAMLDSSFTAISKAKENAEKNQKNSKELFESYLNNIFEKKGKDWEEKKLGDNNLIEIIDGDRGKNYPSKKDFFPVEYCLFMNTKNVRENGFDFTTKMFITQAKDNAMGKGKLKRNDVVMTTRGTIGNLGVYNNEVKYENIRINSGMLIFRPNIKLITPDYLFTLLRSSIVKSQITKHVSGAAQPQLPIKTLVNFLLPLPPLTEQKRIVAKLDALSEQTKKLEAVYSKKIADLDELKKSILQKAFRGEL